MVAGSVAEEKKLNSVYRYNKDCVGTNYYVIQLYSIHGNTMGYTPCHALFRVSTQ